MKIIDNKPIDLTEDEWNIYQEMIKSGKNIKELY